MSPPFVALCNGAGLPSGAPQDARVHTFHYLPDAPCQQRVRIAIPAFLRTVYHLPPRVLDLLEIASYVYAVDRCVARGPTETVEYQSWGRRITVAVRVRDHAFWTGVEASGLLDELLGFLSGDEFHLAFEPGHATPAASLFDHEDFDEAWDAGGAEVMLFSGGLDSLAGALSVLADPSRSVCLVSHRSGATGTIATQKGLVDALRKRFGARVRHVSFECGLTGLRRAKDENQRTRFFLYSSIALAVAHAVGSRRLSVYENGVTSLNLAKRRDLMNARATRTTHPKTIRALRELFAKVDPGATLQTPFFDLTKTDVLEVLAKSGGRDLYSSSVSCSKTFRTSAATTHCGGCSQCVDRRFAAFAAGLAEEDDVGTYELDILRAPLAAPNLEQRGTVVDFMAQAAEFARGSAAKFEHERFPEIALAAEGILEDTEEHEIVPRLWALLHRHGNQVAQAYKEMRERHDDPMSPRGEDSLFALTEGRQHLRDPRERLAERLGPVLARGLELANKTDRPSNEQALNDQIEALLANEREGVEREFPSIPFATKKNVPDHAVGHVVIEAKYPRGTSRRLNEINDEMRGDVLVYGKVGYVLFVVYDPEKRIKDDGRFVRDFEQHGCSVFIVRS